MCDEFGTEPELGWTDEKIFEWIDGFMDKLIGIWKDRSLYKRKGTKEEREEKGRKRAREGEGRKEW